MRRNTWLALSLLALSTLAAVGWGSRAQGASRTNWEYKVVTSYTPHSTTPTKMNELGAEGWELVSVLATEEQIGNIVNVKREFYYKRAK